VARLQAARSRQAGREQDDQQRPEIVDQPGLGRRREAQGAEVKGVIAEQAAHPEQPDRPGLEERAGARRSGDPGQAAAQAADQEGHGGELERRHRAGGRGEQREQRPEQDGAEAREGRGRTWRAAGQG
jgi:hypothetical protein